MFNHQQRVAIATFFNTLFIYGCSYLTMPLKMVHRAIAAITFSITPLQQSLSPCLVPIRVKSSQVAANLPEYRAYRQR